MNKSKRYSPHGVRNNPHFVNKIRIMKILCCKLFWTINFKTEAMLRGLRSTNSIFPASQLLMKVQFSAQSHFRRQLLKSRKPLCFVFRLSLLDRSFIDADFKYYPCLFKDYLLQCKQMKMFCWGVKILQI